MGIGERQVYWGQGAFLSPQHLQAQDAWHQAMRLELRRCLQPWPWGFEELSLRPDALDTGVVDIERMVLRTREGERLAGGSGTGGSGNVRFRERALRDLAVRDNEPVSLWLVLAQERTVEGLVAGGRLSERHVLASAELSDPFDPQAPAASVDFLLYQPMVVTSLDENAEALLRACEAYKFAEVVAAGPGRFRLSNDYVPPLLALRASTNLLRWTRALRDLLVSRGQDFAATKRQRGIRAASTSAQEAMRVVMMQTFARHIPAFEEHVRLGTVPAHALYQALRTLVAEFSVFSEEVGFFGGIGSDAATLLPDYDHDDLRRCFRIAFDRAEALVKALTVGAEVGVTLAFDGRFYKSDLPATLFESDRTRFYLAFESELRGQDLFTRLSRTGKIASMDEMPRLLSAALFGLKIDLLPVPPEELPQKTPNTTYFLVDTTHPFWQMIRTARNIAVSCDLSPDDTVIKLYPVATEA